MMTFREAAARIEDHMIVHRISETNALKITEALQIAVRLLRKVEGKDLYEVTSSGKMIPLFTKEDHERSLKL